MRPEPPRRVFSWREFFADQAINIVASVGAFLLLIGSLSFTITTSNLFVAFLVLFIVHAIFGITGFVTYRFQTFRFVAIIYTIIFALLIPLVAFSLYRLLIGSHIEFSVPVLVAISATYAAIIYILMAVYQRFIPFAYLGLVALLVADLAVSDALNLYYWWWPSIRYSCDNLFEAWWRKHVAFYRSLGSAARSSALCNVFHCGCQFAGSLSHRDVFSWT